MPKFQRGDIVDSVLAYKQTNKGLLYIITVTKTDYLYNSTQYEAVTDYPHEQFEYYEELYTNIFRL